jgi:FixJ family two-component response regulator
MYPTRRSICVVDDDESVRKALGRLLRSLRMDAETFATAEEYLQRAAALPPDCLILDVHLPGLSGLELQKRLTAGGCDIPVVFITAFADDTAREQALRAGALAFLQKPFEEQLLLDAVNQAVAFHHGK